MPSASFQIVRCTDRDFVQSLVQFRDLNPGVEFKVKFHFLSDSGGGSHQFSAPVVVLKSELESNDDVNFVCKCDCRIFSKVIVEFGEGASVSVRRHSVNESQQAFTNRDNDKPFDIITVTEVDDKRLAQRISQFQQLFAHLSVTSLGDFLGDSAKIHFEAREAALTRLESMVSSYLTELESARRKSDAEVEAKRKELEASQNDKNLKLEQWRDEENERIQRRKNELDKREESLNLQEPKTERRRVFGELEKTFNSWNTSFKLSAGPSTQRWPIHILMCGLVLFLAGLVWYFMCNSLDFLEKFQSGGGVSTPEVIFLFVRTGVFLVLAVSFVSYYVRWMNSWQMKHAEEEFRLKRLQLDTKRAHWFVELAFQWRDEFDESVPPDLADRLTRNLFEDVGSNNNQDTRYEPMLRALLGVDSKLTVSPTGPKLEVGTKGVKAVANELTQSQESA